MCIRDRLAIVGQQTDFVQPAEDGLALVAGRRRGLVDGELPVAPDDKISKRAADINANESGSSHVHR